MIAASVALPRMSMVTPAAYKVRPLTQLQIYIWTLGTLESIKY
jgi:hypothetical protein